MIFALFVLSRLLALCQSSIFVSSLSSRTVNIEKAPYQVSLYKNGYFWCSGSILSRRWILTVAHCMLEDAPRSVRVGGDVLYEGPEFPVMRVIKYPDYLGPGNVAHDIALLDLGGEVLPLDGYRVKAVRLVPPDTVALPGDSLLLTSWDTQYEPFELLQRYVDVLDRSYCYHSTPNMYCVSSGLLEGDSGIPVILNDNVQIGIVSHGYHMTSNFQDEIVNVAAYRDWIYSITGI